MSIITTRGVPMTIRGRLYLAITAAQHWALSFTLFFAPHLYASPAFETIRDISGGRIDAWGIGFAVVSIVATLAALSGSEMTARVALTISAMITGFWALSFVIAAVQGEAVGPSAYIIWSAMVAKDLVVGYYPLTSPLEPLLRRFYAHHPETAPLHRRVTDLPAGTGS